MEFINNDIHVDENGTIDFSSTETFKAISGDMLFVSLCNINRPFSIITSSLRKLLPKLE